MVRYFNKFHHVSHLWCYKTVDRPCHRWTPVIPPPPDRNFLQCLSTLTLVEWKGRRDIFFRRYPIMRNWKHVDAECGKCYLPFLRWGNQRRGSRSWGKMTWQWRLFDNLAWGPQASFRKEWSRQSTWRHSNKTIRTWQQSSGNQSWSKGEDCIRRFELQRKWFPLTPGKNMKMKWITISFHMTSYGKNATQLSCLTHNLQQIILSFHFQKNPRFCNLRIRTLFLPN